jgi:choline dehydrogenase-like flavoprotein
VRSNPESEARLPRSAFELSRLGKVLGGGSSINVMAWVRGHKNDWDFFASSTLVTEW